MSKTQDNVKEKIAYYKNEQLPQIVSEISTIETQLRNKKLEVNNLEAQLESLKKSSERILGLINFYNEVENSSNQ